MLLLPPFPFYYLWESLYHLNNLWIWYRHFSMSPAPLPCLSLLQEAYPEVHKCNTLASFLRTTLAPRALSTEGMRLECYFGAVYLPAHLECAGKEKNWCENAVPLKTGSYRRQRTASAAGTRPLDLKPTSKTFRGTFLEDKSEQQNSWVQNNAKYHWTQWKAGMSAVHELLNPQQKEQIALSPLTEICTWQIFNLPLLSYT